MFDFSTCPILDKLQNDLLFSSGSGILFYQVDDMGKIIGRKYFADVKEMKVHDFCFEIIHQINGSLYRELLRRKYYFWID